MNDTKDTGMDVHRESISMTALNSAGKIVLKWVVQTLSFGCDNSNQVIR